MSKPKQPRSNPLHAGLTARAWYEQYVKQEFAVLDRENRIATALAGCEVVQELCYMINRGVRFPTGAVPLPIHIANIMEMVRRELFLGLPGKGTAFINTARDMQEVHGETAVYGGAAL